MPSVIEQDTRAPGRFLRLPEVMARTGLSRSTIYVRLDQGRFPRRSRWAFARSAGSRRRWTSECASGSRGPATRREGITGPPGF